MGGHGGVFNHLFFKILHLFLFLFRPSISVFSHLTSQQQSELTERRETIEAGHWRGDPTGRGGGVGAAGGGVEEGAQEKLPPRCSVLPGSLLWLSCEKWGTLKLLRRPRYRPTSRLFAVPPLPPRRSLPSRSSLSGVLCSTAQINGTDEAAAIFHRPFFFFFSQTLSVTV